MTATYRLQLSDAAIVGAPWQKPPPAGPTLIRFIHCLLDACLCELPDGQKPLRTFTTLLRIGISLIWIRFSIITLSVQVKPSDSPYSYRLFIVDVSFLNIACNTLLLPLLVSLPRFLRANCEQISWENRLAECALDRHSFLHESWSSLSCLCIHLLITLWPPQ